MDIQVIGNNAIMHANPIQNLVRFGVMVLAIDIISRIPGARADQSAAEDVEICKKICEPLPGDENNAPEKTCNEVCTKGGTITKTRKWIGQKVGEWVPYAKPVAEVAVPLIDCVAVCNASPKIYLSEVAWELLWHGNKIKAGIASAKAGCAAISYTPAGVVGCGVCCAGIKGVEFVANAGAG